MKGWPDFEIHELVLETEEVIYQTTLLCKRTVYNAVSDDIFFIVGTYDDHVVGRKSYTASYGVKGWIAFLEFNSYRKLMFE